jgi:(1->4)-alpha-D-glucan 1-alpha-D-glucosylmutase
MNIPTTTYRLQFNAQFGFRHVARIASYLAALGVSHIYASPIFKAREGSAHGYDGVDPNSLNPELGTDSDFDELHRGLAASRLGWVQDIVPNHMAFDSSNRMLMDVLQNGSASTYYTFFDIEWYQPQDGMQDQLMAPFLGRRLAECLQNEELKLSFDESGFAVNYYHLKLPLKMATYAELLKPIGISLQKKCGDSDADYSLFVKVIQRLESLAGLTSAEKRQSRIEEINNSLKDLYDERPLIRQCIDETLQAYTEGQKNGDCLVRLARLLCRQAFRLCHWKVAGEEINYRRFFDINELICLRQEKRAVFDATHQLIKQLVDDGYCDGVRVDHVDGLADPHRYLQRLKAHLATPYILVEKILEPQESLPAAWPVQGTTGYDFTHRLNGLFCITENEEKFSRIYAAFSQQTAGFKQIVRHCKRQVLKNQLGGELGNLARRIKRVAGQTLWGCDLTHARLKKGLTEILAHFPVYRTYIDHKRPSAVDYAVIRAAVKSASRRQPRLTTELMFIQQVLLGRINTQFCNDHLDIKQAVEKIMVKFQQLTAPLTAKGVEDTALYVYNRLISLNEVGGNPHQFGCSADDFHTFIKSRADQWPHTMNSTATHDSKRGEDVRARINVLSELPAEWDDHLNRWHGLNRDKKMRLNGREVPDRNEEYLLYQTLLGAFPFDGVPSPAFIERISQYMVKAAREAKIHSSWTEVNAAYEAALVSYAQKILHPIEGQPFLKEFLPFFKKIAFYGIWNSLSQTLLKITAPGVPDFYQGTELFDFHLVDPDNRRPVDFKKRKRLLTEIDNTFASDPLGLIEELLANCRNGRIKLFLTAQALRTRQSHAVLFQHGSYIPLAVSGRFKAHVIALARTDEKHCSITVVPRFLTGLIQENQKPLGNRVWHDSRIMLPEKATSRWKNIFTQESLRASAALKTGHILRHFPCALLTREETP